MRPWLRRLLRGYSLVVFALLLLPLLIVVPISFSSARYLQFPPPGWSLQWYKRYLYDPAWIEATMVSLRVACGSTLLALILGTALAYSVVRGRYRGRVVVERLGSGPLIVPHIVIAIAIYSLFARMHLTGTETGLILAHTVLAIPFVLAVMSASLRTVDPVLEQAAMSLGVSRIGAIVRDPAAHPPRHRVGRHPGLPVVLRRGGGGHLPQRHDQDAAQADVRQHHERDRPDHRRHLGPADRPGGGGAGAGGPVRRQGGPALKRVCAGARFMVLSRP